MSGQYIWKPSPAVVDYSNVGRFMRRHGIATYRELIARSTATSSGSGERRSRTWRSSFTSPFDSVLDSSGGIAWTTWFRGGTINLAHHCLDRHARSARRDHVAVIAEGEDGVVRRLIVRRASRGDAAGWPMRSRAWASGRGMRSGFFCR